MCHNTEDCRVEFASVKDSSFVDRSHQPVSTKSQGGYWDEYKMLIKNVDFPMFYRTVSPKNSFDRTTHSMDH